MNETQTPPVAVGENYLAAFKGSGVTLEGPGTARKTRPVTGGLDVIGIGEVKPITDGILDSTAVMLKVKAPDADQKKDLAKAWVPMANKYKHWFRRTPEIAAAFGTFACMAPMFGEYNDRIAREKEARAEQASGDEGTTSVEPSQESDF